jgi:hypothetical protein
MEKIIAAFVKEIGRVPVDGPIEVVFREKARHPILPAWNYRFKSGEEWIVAPLDAVVGFVFADKPGGRAEGERAEDGKEEGRTLPAGPFIDACEGVTFIDW